MSRGDKEDLRRRLCVILDVALQVVQKLADKGYSGKVESELNIRPEKIISETAVLLLGAGACTDPEIVHRVNLTAQLLLPYARSSRIGLGLCLEPSLALDYAEAHACLSRLGHCDSGFDAFVGTALKSQAMEGHERPPHRQLQQSWVAELLGKPSEGSLAKRQNILLDSALGQRLDLLNCTREDVYAFTHALMYAFDRNTPGCQPPRPIAEIFADAETLLARCLDEEDYDLAGEILLAWPLMDGLWTPSSIFAFGVLAAVEDTAGFLPSPATRIKKLGELSGEERSAYLFATAYHTVYVMGLLASACLVREKFPPAQIPEQGSQVGTAQYLLLLLDRDGRRPHWRPEFDKLESGERDALAAFLFDIALRRRVVARDFQGLHELLVYAAENGLANAPAASQAAEILERLIQANSALHRVSS